MSSTVSPPVSVPVLIDAAGIAARIPHAGRMALLETCLAWDAQRIHCQALATHRAGDHPLRSASGLLASAAIEYAAQAMALHGGLLAEQRGQTPGPGFLASARQVELACWRLDELPGALDIEAERQAGDAQQILYSFTVSHQGAWVARGRAAVVLDTPLPDPAT